MEKFKNFVESIAIVSAGLFALYLIPQGYFSAASSLKLESSRVLKEDETGMDYLMCTASFERFSRTADVEDIKSRVFCGDRKHYKISSCDFFGIETFPENSDSKKEEDEKNKVRVEDSENTVKNPIIQWIGKKENLSILCLRPGSKSQFSCLAIVPHHLPCTIETAILVRKKFSLTASLGTDTPFEVWRASTISLPLEKAEAKKEGR